MGIFTRTKSKPKYIHVGRPGPQGPRGERGPAGKGLYTPAITFHVANGANVPTFAHGADAARDLAANETAHIKPGETLAIGTGVSIVGGLPRGWAGLVLSRSGLALKGVVVANSPGLVDPGYTGEIKVLLHNRGRRTYTVDKGARIAQFMVIPCAGGTGETSMRGGNGFGSTGVAPLEDKPALETVKLWPEPPADANLRQADITDPVNRPAHYAQHPIFKGQAWDITRRMPFAQGNAVKYLWRHADKADPVQDIRKAVWYLQHMVTDVCDTRDVPANKYTGALEVAQDHFNARCREAGLSSARSWYDRALQATPKQLRSTEFTTLMRMGANLIVWQAMTEVMGINDGLPMNYRRNLVQKITDRLEQAVDIFETLPNRQRTNPNGDW